MSGLKQAARAVLAFGPVRRVIQRRALSGDPVTVLCYHTIGPDRGGPDAWTVLRATDLRAHLEMIAEDYDIVPLATAVHDQPGRPGSRRPRVVLTFDDGEAGLFRHLLPMLDDLRVPVTVYVATAQIETGRAYWFDRIMGALGEGARRVDVSGLGHWDIPARPGNTRWAVLGDLLEAMKRVDPATREEMADAILSVHPLPDGRAPMGPMTLTELQALAASPWVMIGAHSHCHNLLDQIPVAEARASMARSAELLREWTGQEIAHFAWPNGNHSAALRDAAREIGFETAVALDGGLWRAGDDRFAIPRVGVGRHDDAARLRLRMMGF